MMRIKWSNIPFRGNGGSKGGFTFVEIMIVTALVSVLGLVLGAALNNGLSIWHKVNDIVVEEDVAIFFDRFTLDLKNVINMGSIKITGDEESISVPSPVSDADGNTVPGRVTYLYSTSKRAILTQKVTFSQIFTGYGLKEREVVDNVAFAAFQFYVYDSATRTYGWVKEYGGGVLTAVRLTLKVRNGKEYDEYEKTVNIPVGKIEPYEEQEG